MPFWPQPVRLRSRRMLKPPESSSKAFEDGARFPVVLPKFEEVRGPMDSGRRGLGEASFFGAFAVLLDDVTEFGAGYFGSGRSVK